MSNDGSLIAFVAPVEATTRLWVHDMETGEARDLQGTDGAYSPFFSPDNQWVGFFAGSDLKKVRLDGGQVVPLADAPDISVGGVWLSDDRVLYGFDQGSKFLTVPAAGGEPDTDTSFMGEYLWFRNDGPNGFLTACPHLATFAAEWSKELGRPVDVKLLLATRGKSVAVDTMLDYGGPHGGGPIDFVLAGVPLGDPSHRAVTEPANKVGFWNRLFGTGS